MNKQSAAKSKQGNGKDTPKKGTSVGGKSPNPTAGKLGAAGPKPLVLTNMNKKKGVDYSKPTLPASFQSKFGEHRMYMEGNQHRKQLNADIQDFTNQNYFSQTQDLSRQNFGGIDLVDYRTGGAGTGSGMREQSAPRGTAGFPGQFSPQNQQISNFRDEPMQQHAQFMN